MICHRLTLTKGQGHRVHLKFGKMALFEFFGNISYAIYITVMKLGHKVAYEETFKMVCHRSSLTEGQGHKINLKCENWHFLLFLKFNLSGTIYSRVLNFG